ncbi:MAG TPA: sugar phosphate isomerase/epimerase, partial [Lacipirellulaceae bacterium]|nr:sugar phosphate isomerase/epimerase [Lacipirellulaceae bacterium]
MNDIGIGVQLYTLRDLTAKDMPGTLKAVAAMGYGAVELAGYGNLKSAAEVKKALDAAGLKAPAGHWAIDVLEKEHERIMEEVQVLGVQQVVVPFLAEARRGKDTEAWKQLAKVLDQIGSYFHGIGVELAYHNHAFEFQKFDGKYALDILFENTTPHLVKAEIDVYWVRHAGEDPAAYVDKLGDRVRMLHLKDMAEGAEKRFAPVGTGTMNFKAILAAADKHGVRWGFVEQDNTYDTPPLEAIRTSLENLKT